MDMANAYYSWISENFPQAHIVFDHFHVIKLMNDKLDFVRRRITAKMDESQRKQLKGLRFIFLRNNEDLPEDAKELLLEAFLLNVLLCFSYNPKTNICISFSWITPYTA